MIGSNDSYLHYILGIDHQLRKKAYMALSKKIINQKWTMGIIETNSITIQITCFKLKKNSHRLTRFACLKFYKILSQQKTG